MSETDVSARLRSLEQQQVNLQTRLGVAERINDQLRVELGSLRKEQRRDMGRILEQLETIQVELAKWDGVRRGIAWFAGLGITLGGALLGAWATLRGRGA